MTYFPSYSYEQHYQAVRRCWRYGQTQPVTVDVITTTGGQQALKALIRKGEQAARMFDALTRHMRNALQIRRDTDYPEPIQMPAWL
jgi:chemotaxis response regulator CheB